MTGQPQTGQPQTGPHPPRRPAVDVAAVRHPTESTWFVASVVLAGIVMLWLLVMVLAAGLLLQLLLVVVVVLAPVWFSVQMLRLRAVAEAVQVGPDSLPQVHALVSEVRARLGHEGRLEVFVTTGLKSPLVVLSFLGTKMLIIDGTTVSKLRDRAHRSQAAFQIASGVGYLVAREAWWGPARLLLTHLGLQWLMAPVVTPWQRGMVLTGDRLAYLCTADLGGSLRSLHRSVVGEELADDLTPAVMLTQDQRVRHRFMLRRIEWLSPRPFATTRYRELLAWVAARDPQSFTGQWQALTPRAQEHLREFLPA